MKVKNIVWSLLAVCVLLAGVFSFSACEPTPDNSGGISIRMIVLSLDNESILDTTFDTTESMWADVLDDIDGFSAEVNAFGYLDAVTVNGTRVAGVASESTFLALYHSIQDLQYQYIGDDVENLSYGGNSYFSSGVGATQLPLFDGQTYIIKHASWA